MSGSVVVPLRRAFRAGQRERAAAARWVAAAGRWASAEVLPADDGAAYVAVQHRSDRYHVVQDARGMWEAVFAPDCAADGGPECGDSLGVFPSLADALGAIWPVEPR